MLPNDVLVAPPRLDGAATASQSVSQSICGKAQLAPNGRHT
jgi:hypothetical protein